MLILSRKPHESVMIGLDITLTVLSVHGKQVRIGVQAPRHIPVHREEVFEAIQRELQELEAAGKSK